MPLFPNQPVGVPMQGGQNGQAPAYGPMQLLAMQMANYKPPNQQPGAGQAPGGGINPNQIGMPTSQAPYQPPQAPVGYGPTPQMGAPQTGTRELQEMSRQMQDTYLPPTAYNTQFRPEDQILRELMMAYAPPQQQQFPRAGFIPDTNRY